MKDSVLQQHNTKFYKTRYYPVNYASGIIYNDPQKTERACNSITSEKYRNLKTVGMKGDRLNTRQVYSYFAVVDPPTKESCSGRIEICVPGNTVAEQLDNIASMDNITPAQRKAITYAASAIRFLEEKTK